MSAVESWPAQWLRGPLPLCVLTIVKRGETHGYAIAVSLKSMGLGTVSGGTLYPILNRLQRDGLLDSQWRSGEGGPGRKVYTLTEHGSAELATQSHLWTQYAALTSQALLPHAVEGHER